MKSARNQLILLGMVCQGFGWDDWLLPTMNALLWVLCLTLPRRPVYLGPLTEVLFLFGGAVLGFQASRMAGTSVHFFIGHGVTLMQAVRLLRPLNQREKIFSMLMASLQISVACTVVLDYRFVLILAAMLVAVPRALAELAAESFTFGTEAFPAATPRPRPRIGRTGFLLIGGVTLLFFLIFPRGVIQTSRPTSARGQEGSSLLDSVMDPTRGASQPSGRVIMQVDAPSLGYLRCFALTDFDGVIWSKQRADGWLRIAFNPEAERQNWPLRRVRVKNALLLNRVLPVDGRVATLKGGFFRSAFQTIHGTVECNFIWNTANNLYEYRIDPNPPRERLSRSMAVDLVRAPPQSPRLAAWLDSLLAEEPDPLKQAKKLEAHFREKFTYRLGAPALNRLGALDDFIFNQREGHCERYASAMAALLRMKGVPSRVVVGYAPTKRNWFSGWFDIRNKDAHAWTEGWFPNAGWVQFDATPRSTLTEPPFDFTELFEELDSAWYSHVVNLDAAAQNQMLTEAVQMVGALGGLARDNAVWLAVLAGLVAAIGWLVVLRRRWRRLRTALQSREQSVILAEHYYGRMLQALARGGWWRGASQTPHEFLAHLQQERAPALEEARCITSIFCETRYGEQPLTAEKVGRVEASLSRLKDASQSKH